MIRMLGAGFCIVCIYLAAGGLHEGVTSRAWNETGTFLPDEEKNVAARLRLLAALVGLAALGGLLARAGATKETFGARPWWRPAAGAVAELLSFLAAVSLLAAALVAAGSARAAAPVAPAYHRLGAGAAVAAPLLLGAAWWLRGRLRAP